MQQANKLRFLGKGSNTMNIENLKNMLYNAIICWYDDALEEYSGLDDENFMHRVCKETGLTRAEYKDLMFSN